MLMPFVSAFTGSSANYNATISNIDFATSDGSSANYNASFSLVQQPVETFASTNYMGNVGFYYSIFLKIVEKIRESYWMLAVLISLIGAIIVMFCLCQMTDNWMMKIPCYVSQVLLLVITIHFSFVALTAYENTTLINSIMQTLYAVVLKALVIPMYIVLIIYLIYDSVQKMQQTDLNKF